MSNFIQHDCALLELAFSYAVQHTTFQYLGLLVQEDVDLDQILYSLKQCNITC